MFPHERHDAILELARAQGRVEVAMLVERLSVAAETVRRDLGVLERQGQLHRVYGGAVYVGGNEFEPLLARRNQQHQPEKAAMADVAVSLITELAPGATVLLDSGSGSEAVARALPSDTVVTVVTNGLPVAVELATKPQITTRCLGGRLSASTLACMEDWAISQLANLTVDLAFIGIDGVTVDKGLSTVDPAEAAIKRAMVDSARRRVVLARHGKIGRDAFCRFATLNEIDIVIVDNQVDEAIVQEIEQAGPRLIVART